MSQFKVGDRVRVRDLTAVGSYAGQVGVVIGLSRTLNPAPCACCVRLDGSLSGKRDDSGVVFAPHELEPVQGGDTP